MSGGNSSAQPVGSASCPKAHRLAQPAPPGWTGKILQRDGLRSGELRLNPQLSLGHGCRLVHLYQLLHVGERKRIEVEAAQQETSVVEPPRPAVKPRSRPP